MSNLVIGGTGSVGSHIVGKLAARGDSVTIMTRSPEKLALLPEGIRGVLANLADPPSLLRIFDGIETVVLITVVHPDETAHGLNAVRAARKAGVKKIVYMSVVMPPDSNHIPHFASKVPIENAVRESGMAFTILRPNNFFQNDLWYKDAMMQYGFYPQPIGSVGLNRVDIRDIAEAAVRTLTSSSHDGKTINIHGPDVLTGKSCAATWGRHLNTEVNYMGDDLAQWSESAGASLPAWMVQDFRIMYDYFQKRGLKAAPGDLEQLEALLGRRPNSFDSFCMETAAGWKEKPRGSE